MIFGESHIERAERLSQDARQLVLKHGIDKMPSPGRDSYHDCEYGVQIREFAWWPTKLANGQWAWLRHIYYRGVVLGYDDGHFMQYPIPFVHRRYRQFPFPYPTRCKGCASACGGWCSLESGRRAADDSRSCDSWGVL